LALARSAAGERPALRPAGLHTLAAVHAERGEPAKALEALEQSIDLREGKPRSDDWYVLGRIAEAYGLADAAIPLYRKVAPPNVNTAVSPYALAQRRLKALADNRNP
jgi:hypothetical protein